MIIIVEKHQIMIILTRSDKGTRTLAGVYDPKAAVSYGELVSY